MHPKELVRQDFAELSGELSGAICLKTCEVVDLLAPPKPRKIKSSSKVTKK